jgi:hypothetical protein
MFVNDWSGEQPCLSVVKSKFKSPNIESISNINIAAHLVTLFCKLECFPETGSLNHLNEMVKLTPR